MTDENSQNERRQADRDGDTWASDASFIADLLAFVISRSRVHTDQWRNIIRLYWREHRSRLEVAQTVDIKPEALKAKLALIRKSAREFLQVYQAADKSPETFRVEGGLGSYEQVHSIGYKDVIRAYGGIDPFTQEVFEIDGDSEARKYIEEYGQLEREKLSDLMTSFREDPWGWGRAAVGSDTDHRTQVPRPRGRPSKVELATQHEIGRFGVGRDVPREEYEEIMRRVAVQDDIHPLYSDTERYLRCWELFGQLHPEYLENLQHGLEQAIVEVLKELLEQTTMNLLEIFERLNLNLKQQNAILERLAAAIEQKNARELPLEDPRQWIH